MIKKPIALICVVLMLITLTTPTKTNEPMISDKTFFGSVIMVAGVAMWAWSLKNFINKINPTPTVLYRTVYESVSIPYRLPSNDPFRYPEFVNQKIIAQFNEPYINYDEIFFSDAKTIFTSTLASWIGTHLILFGTYLQQ